MPGAVGTPGPLPWGSVLGRLGRRWPRSTPKGGKAERTKQELQNNSTAETPFVFSFFFLSLRF